ncbi:MAG TPA: thioredoxin domain-containing protein [Candidatus Angelobacter sp.]|jgi:protein-disulfide isomerase|nr:thioredoxin domain-containing protein [Candidatus Angelobacter sp.]
MLACPVFTVAQSAIKTGSSLPTEATVDGFLKQMFGWNQDLTWKVAEIKPAEAPGFAEVTAVFNTPQGQQVFKVFVTPDQKFALTGDIVPFGADPFAAARADLKAADGPAHGPADATATIVEFGDLECPACKAAQANLTKLSQEEPKAKLIFQNFPLESLHKWAMLGAKYVDCVSQQGNDTTFKFIATVYEHQGEITADTAAAMLKGYAKDSGANPDAVAACVVKPETEAHVRKSLALGEKLNVNSTPTFFVNGRKVVGFGNNTPYEVVKAMVEFYAAPAK